MSDPFIAEVRIFAGTFAPWSWAFCNGQLIQIVQNTALFSLIGTTYGGDGQSTMALPNLQGRAPMHPGSGPGLSERRLGQQIGTTTVTLSQAELPSHTHRFSGSSSDGNVNQPTTNSAVAAAQTETRGGTGPLSVYQTDTAANLVNLASQALSTTGGGQSHDNAQPFLVLNFIIALEGIFPSRG